MKFVQNGAGVAVRVVIAGAPGVGAQALRRVGWPHGGCLAHRAWRQCGGQPRGRAGRHATGPRPARNAELRSALRAGLHRPLAPPTPVALVRLGAILLRTDPAWPSPAAAPPSRLVTQGFQFAHPDLDEALADLLTRGSGR